MATPYQVPSLSDIMYTRSRTPTPQQITLNNLMSFLNNAQQIKSETEAERSRREFTQQREREEREWRTAEMQKDRSIAAEKERKNDMQRRFDRLSRERETIRQEKRQDFGFNFNHAIRAADRNQFGQAKIIMKMTKDLAYDTGRGEMYDSTITDINEMEKKYDGEQRAENLAFKYRDGKMSIEDLYAEKDWMDYSTRASHDIVYNRRMRQMDRLSSADKFELEWRLKGYRDDIVTTLENIREYRHDTNQKDEKGNPRPGTALENEIIRYDELNREADDTIQNYKDILSGATTRTLKENQFTLQDAEKAAEWWINNTDVRDSDGNRLGRATPEAVNHIMGLVDSGELVWYVPGGFISGLLPREEAERRGLVDKLDEEDDDGDKDDTVEKTMEDYQKELEGFIQTAIEDKDTPKGGKGMYYTQNQLSSYMGDTGTGGEGDRINPEDNRYVSERGREYAAIATYLQSAAEQATKSYRLKIRKFKPDSNTEYQKKLQVEIKNTVNKREASLQHLTALRDRIRLAMSNQEPTMILDAKERRHFKTLLTKIERELYRAENGGNILYLGYSPFKQKAMLPFK